MNLLKLAVCAIALLIFAIASPANACDGVAALSGCYSQNIRQRVVVEKVCQPQYVERIVERVEVPQYVVREQIVERQKIVRQRRAPLLQLNLGQRQKIVKRERVVERVRGY